MGLKAKGSGTLYTMEPEREKFDYARKTLIDYPVRFMFAATIGINKLASPQEVEASGVFAGKEWRDWLAADIAFARALPAPQLRAQCAKRKFDAINIDGGEFAGPGEWRIVRDFCKPRYIALHDTNVFKTRSALAEMLSRPDLYRLIARGDPPGP